MKKRLPFAALATSVLASVGILSAAADPIPFDDFARQPDLSSVSMSLEGDMLVAVVADPDDPENKRAAAYWDLPADNADIDTSGPIAPTAVTPTTGRSKFYAAAALKQKKSLWFTVQAYTGALMGCGEGKTTGSTKKYIQKVYMGNELIRKIDDLPAGRTEIGGDTVKDP